MDLDLLAAVLFGLVCVFCAGLLRSASTPVDGT